MLLAVFILIAGIVFVFVLNLILSAAGQHKFLEKHGSKMYILILIITVLILVFGGF